MEVQFIEVPWPQIIPALKSHKIDIIMSGMSITEERSQMVNFTDPYFSISQMLLVRRPEMSRFKKPGTGYYVKSGFSVGVSKGTTGESLARKYLPNNRITSFDTVREGVLALKGSILIVFCMMHPQSGTMPMATTMR